MELLVEQLGFGIPRILQTYGRECFKFSDNYFRMSFPIEKGGESEAAIKTNEKLNGGVNSLYVLISGKWRN
jgi:hypothetical protein